MNTMQTLVLLIVTHTQLMSKMKPLSYVKAIILTQLKASISSESIRTFSLKQLLSVLSTHLIVVCMVMLYLCSYSICACRVDERPILHQADWRAVIFVAEWALERNDEKR